MCVTKEKKSIGNNYILYDPHYMTLWKMQNHGGNKKVSG